MSNADEREVRCGIGASFVVVASIAGFILVDRLVTPLPAWMAAALIVGCLAAVMLLRRR